MSQAKRGSKSFQISGKVLEELEKAAVLTGINTGEFVRLLVHFKACNFAQQLLLMRSNDHTQTSHDLARSTLDSSNSPGRDQVPTSHDQTPTSLDISVQSSRDLVPTSHDHVPTSHDKPEFTKIDWQEFSLIPTISQLLRTNQSQQVMTFTQVV